MQKKDIILRTTHARNFGANSVENSENLLFIT
jgi:hypothetical protein